MKLRMYSILDSKAAVFGYPHIFQTDGSAIREFSDRVNDSSIQNNQWFKHPEDFSLFFIGEFDEDTAHIITSIPKSLVTASALKSAISDTEKPLSIN